MHIRHHLVVVAMLIAGLGIASLSDAQQAVPTENKGIKTDVLIQYELGKQGLNDYQDRSLRVRRTIIDPGGVIAVHSHRFRPAMIYVISGAITEHRKDGTAKEAKAGDAIAETADVNHWVENLSDQPAVILTVDLYKP